MSTYILQKDYSVPGMEIKLGTESTFSERNGKAIYSFCNSKQCKLFNNSEVENNPEWFKLKEEKLGNLKQVVFEKKNGVICFQFNSGDWLFNR